MIRTLLGCIGLLFISTFVRASELPKVTRAFIEANCLDCHDVESARAGFRIDLLTDDFTSGNSAGQWKEMMDKINSGEMPPKKRTKRPDAKEAFAVTTWIAGRLRETELAAQGAGGRVPMRRMNRVEYANSVRDLFSLDENFARRIERELPADGKVGGFDRGAESLFMDEGQLDQYLAVADLVLKMGVFGEKPLVKKFTSDPTKEKYIHGIGVSYKDEAGKVIDNNPTPALVAELKDPLSKIAIDNFGGNSKEYNYVPHGPFHWTLKNGGIEYLSGGNNHRSPGNLRSPFYPEDWGKKGVLGDGWYRFKINAGAFHGEGKDAQKEVRLVVEYGFGSPIEVVKSQVIDAPLDAPKEYEFLMYLQAGPPGMDRSWRVGWDNGNKDVGITNPMYQDVQWKFITIAGQLEKLKSENKPAEEIAALKKKSEEALAAAAENRKTFAGPYWVFDPKLDVAKRPRLWVGKMEWEGPIVVWPPTGRKTLLFAGEERNDDSYMREIFAKFLPLVYRRPTTPEELDRIVKWTLKAKVDRNLAFIKAVREGVKNVLCSPKFLYLGSEAMPAPGLVKPSSGPQPVDGWQFASRLSYLLWSSIVAGRSALEVADLGCDQSWLTKGNE